MPGGESNLKTSGAAAEQQSTEPADGVVQGCPLKQGWVEVLLVDPDDVPVANQRYLILLPDGTTERTGKTDANGKARVGGFPDGACKVRFPDLDGSLVELVGEAT